jgi:hypothetical protein
VEASIESAEESHKAMLSCDNGACGHGACLKFLHEIRDKNKNNLP